MIINETGPGALLRRMLHSGTPVVAPGAYDPLSARVITSLGFKAVYLGGFASAAPAVILEPLMTMTEQIAIAKRVARAIGPTVPLIVDGHTGFGDPPHIVRAVREFEEAGVAAIHLEDQPFPKLPGYQYQDKQMVSADEMALRLESALGARTDLLIIARTEARTLPGGLDETIRRMRLYADLGVDALIPGVVGLDEATAIREAIPSIPLVWTAGLGRFAPDPREISLDELQSADWQCVLAPLAGIATAIGAVRHMYRDFADNGILNTKGMDETYGEILDLIGAREYYEIERRYRASERAEMS